MSESVCPSGSQKKTSHNLRLMCGNVLDLCRSTAASGRGFMLDPQQLQTAMSLYTSDVCALVMVEETGAATSSREGETQYGNVHCCLP